MQTNSVASFGVYVRCDEHTSDPGASAPLKLRPYGAIQICLLLLLLFLPQVV